MYAQTFHLNKDLNILKIDSFHCHQLWCWIHETDIHRQLFTQCIHFIN